MKTMKRILILLAVLAVITSTTVTVFAEGAVIYDGNAKKFIFEPGSNYSPTDLFSDLKGVMPGDSITQKITVKNDASDEVKVNIYVRSLGAHQDSADFLSQLHMTVAKSADNEMAYMFDAAADQTGGLTDWVLLGTLYSGGEVNLDVTLDVPLELGNEYQEAVGSLDWQFKIEELPKDPGDPQPPQTGINTKLPLYITLMSVSIFGLIFLPVFGRRKNQEEN